MNSEDRLSDHQVRVSSGPVEQLLEKLGGAFRQVACSSEGSPADVYRPGGPGSPDPNERGRGRAMTMELELVARFGGEGGLAGGGDQIVNLEVDQLGGQSPAVDPPARFPTGNPKTTFFVPPRTRLP